VEGLLKKINRTSEERPCGTWGASACGGFKA